MREIKFRGQDLETKDFVYGSLIAHEPCPVIQNPELGENDYDYQSWEVDTDTVGQYTGLKDKNGEEIYEGDYLQIDKSNLEKSFAYSRAGELMKEKQLDSFIIHVEQSEFLNTKILTYLKKDSRILTNDDYYGRGKEKDNSLFYEVSWDLRFLKYIEPFCEVIGNIHSNPELLK